MPNLFKVWKTKKKRYENLKVHVYGCVCGFVCDVIVIYKIWSYECYVNNFTHFIRMRSVSRSMKKRILLTKNDVVCFATSSKNSLHFFVYQKLFAWTWINLRLLLILFQVRLQSTLTLFGFFLGARDGSGVK